MASNKKSIKDVELNGKMVFCRVDFNVPVNKDGKVTDDTRIVRALPTIQYMLAKEARVVLASHFGRPKGKRDMKYSLEPVAKRLAKLLHTEVKMATDCIGEDVEQMKKDLKPGEVLLLENVRFHTGEEANDQALAWEFAKGIDVYVNDAFGTSHRNHASTVGITRFVTKAAAGFLLLTEVKMLDDALEDPARPFTAIVGGAKVSDKILVIDALLDRVDKLIIGGGMANTFIKAMGYEVGKSLVEDDRVKIASDLIEKAKEKNVEMLLPIDVRVAKVIEQDAEFQDVSLANIPTDSMVLDIGPQTIELFGNAVKESATIVWNGPMGVFEYKPFAAGTTQLAEIIAKHDCFSIIGGGDSVAAVEKLGLGDYMDHVSTGGGASLRILEGKKLPGVEALNDREIKEA